MHTCTPWPKPRWRSIARAASKRSGSANSSLVAVGADEQQHHALAGAHLDARDLGVDHERAAHELQRQLVAEHLLERARDRVGLLDQRGALLGRAPELVRAPGDGLGQRLRAADEQRRQLHRDLGVVEGAVRAGVVAQVVDEVARAVVVGRPMITGGAPLGDEVDEVLVQLDVRRLARRR